MKIKPPSAALVAIFERILDDLEPFLPFSAAGVFLEDADYLQLVATRRALTMPLGAVLHLEDAPCYLELKQNRLALLQEDTCTLPLHRIFGEDDLRGWMVVPFIVHEVVVGVVLFAGRQIAFRRRDAHLVQTYLNQAAVLAEKAQLADTLAIEKRNSELLYELSLNLTETLDLQQVAERAVLLTTRALGVAYGEIMLLDPVNPDRLVLFADVDYNELKVADSDDFPFLILGQGTAGWAALHRTPVIAPNIDEEPTWIPLPGLTDDVRSTAAIPLIAQDRLIGVLQLSSTEPGFFTTSRLPALQTVAAPIAMALQNALLFAAEQHRYEVTEAIRLSTSTLTLDLDLPSLLHQLLERLQRVVPFDSTTCFLIEDNAAQAVAMIGIPEAQKVQKRSFPVDDNVRRMIEERKPIFFEDVQETNWYEGWGGTDYVRGWMAVPLIHRGLLIGYISLDSRERGTYGQREAEVAQAFANQAAVTIVNAQLLQESRRTAEEQWTVSQIVRQLNATSEEADILPATAWGLRSLVQCDAVELAIFDAEEIEASVTRHTYSQVGDAIASRQTYFIHESAGADWSRRGQIFQVEDGVAVELGVIERIDIAQGYPTQLTLPLQVGHRTLGALRLLWRSPSGAKTLKMTNLAQIAGAVAMTTERNLLFSQTRRRIEETEVINRLTTSLRPLETQADILQISLTFIQSTFACDVVRLCLTGGDLTDGDLTGSDLTGSDLTSSNLAADDFGSEDESLILVAEVGQPASVQRHLPRTGSILGHVIETGHPYLSSNYLQDPLAHPQLLENWLMLGAPPVSAIFAPVYTGSAVVGVIAGYCLTDQRTYTQDDLHLLGTIAGIIGTALHRSSVLETMEQRVIERTVQLAEANERLQELDRLKSDFIANISHELRTPLTNIRFYADLLRRGRREKHDEYLQTLQQETQQLNALIESVLDLSRLNAARLQGIFFEVSHFDLSQLIHDTCELYEKQAQAKGLTLSHINPTESLMIDADRSQINQIIANVLSNAIAYTDPGGQVEISVHLSQNDGIEISVKDTGIGIPQHELPRLFERFFRGAQATERGLPGAGLGLSIVKEILNLHGGYVHVESELGAGTTVHIWLPTRPNSLHMPEARGDAAVQFAIAEKAKQIDDAT